MVPVGQGAGQWDKWYQWDKEVRQSDRWYQWDKEVGQWDKWYQLDNEVGEWDKWYQWDNEMGQVGTAGLRGGKVRQMVIGTRRWDSGSRR